MQKTHAGSRWETNNQRIGALPTIGFKNSCIQSSKTWIFLNIQEMFVAFFFSQAYLQTLEVRSDGAFVSSLGSIKYCILFCLIPIWWPLAVLGHKATYAMTVWFVSLPLVAALYILIVIYYRSMCHVIH